LIGAKNESVNDGDVVIVGHDLEMRKLKWAIRIILTLEFPGKGVQALEFQGEE
jgi:hypothetical protein